MQKNKPKPTAAWGDVTPEGELLFCYSGRKYGKKFEERLTLKEIKEFIEADLESKNNKTKRIDI